MQSEISQAEKDKYFMVSLTREILKNNKVLLYSTGHYIQHPVINHNEKEYKKECTHKHN